VIHSSRRLTVCEVAEEAAISKTTCHEILTENLDMHCVGAKFMPHLLSEDQKQNSVDVSNEFVDRAENIITGDGIWVYGCDVETKAQS